MEIKNTIEELAKWYSTPLGKALREDEVFYLGKVMADLFCDYLLIEGLNVDIFAFANNKIQNSVYLSQNYLECDSGSICVNGKPSMLPFYNDSIDVVLLYHLLEFDNNPHLILEEAFHILVPNGKLIILGFNPFSFWGLRSLCNNKQKISVPWNGRFISSWHLRNWLLQMGFSIQSYETFGLTLPIQNSLSLKCGGFFEKIGKYLFPYFGGCYILVAEKKLLALTPVTEKEVSKRLPLGAYVRPGVNLTKHEE